MPVQVAFAPITDANKGGSIAFTHALSPYVVDANANWPPVITRYNSAFIRLTAWDTTISFQAQVTPDAVNGDTHFAVVQNGAFFADVTCAADGVKRQIDVPGITLGATIEIWESRQNVTNVGADLNCGVDTPRASGYITGVYVPSGTFNPPASARVNAPQAATVNAPPSATLYVTRPTASTAIVWLGNSIPNFSTDNTPSTFYSALGQARLLAHAQGKLLVDLCYGSGTLGGDGFTMAQRAQDIHRAFAACGAPLIKYLYIDDVRNDWAYYNQGNGAANNAAATAANLAALIAAVQVLDPGTHIIVNTTISQTDESDKGGGTLPAYRTAVSGVSAETIIDGPGLNITKPTYRDDVHMTTAGATRYLNNGVGAALGLL